MTEVENIKSGNKILNDKVSKLEQTVDDVVTKLNEIAEGKTFCFYKLYVYKIKVS